jgi:hypothetical protein
VDGRDRIPPKIFEVCPNKVQKSLAEGVDSGWKEKLLVGIVGMGAPLEAFEKTLGNRTAIAFFEAE